MRKKKGIISILNGLSSKELKSLLGKKYIENYINILNSNELFMTH